MRHAYVLLAITNEWTEVVEVFEKNESALAFKKTLDENKQKDSNVKYCILITELKE